MMDETILKVIREIILEVTGKDDLGFETDFMQDLGLNSFDIMNVVSKFEEHFDTEIPTRDVWQMRKVKDVISYMKKKGITEEFTGK